MKAYTVKQLARLAGVTVRTLHHYDEIGLLRPAHTGANRYRYYGEDELLRLQQILIHRALGIPLGRISEVLDAPDFDRLRLLKAQREKIAADMTQYAAMMTTIDRTIARLEGDMTMKDRDLYSGIVSTDKQAEYEAWLVDRYGPDVNAEIERSHAQISNLTEEDHRKWMEELREIENMLAEGLRRGLPPQSLALEPRWSVTDAGSVRARAGNAGRRPMPSWRTSIGIPISAPAMTPSSPALPTTSSPR